GPPEQALGQVAGDARHERPVAVREEPERFVGTGALREQVAPLQLQRARRRERHDRVDTADVRARDDAAELLPVELSDKGLRLTAAALVQRPQGVVVVPVLAVAGRRMADEVDDHSNAAFAARPSLRQAPGRPARASSRRARSRSTSRPAANAAPELSSSPSSSRSRASATIASWCAPSTSWKALARSTTRLAGSPTSASASSAV